MAQYFHCARVQIPIQNVSQKSKVRPMVKTALFSTLIAGVLFIVSGGQWYAGILMVIGLTFLLDFVEPLAAR